MFAYIDSMSDSLLVATSSASIESVVGGAALHADTAEKMEMIAITLRMAELLRGY